MCKLVLIASYWLKSGSSSPGRATASQAVGSGFESRFPLFFSYASDAGFVSIIPYVEVRRLENPQAVVAGDLASSIDLISGLLEI